MGGAGSGGARRGSGRKAGGPRAQRLTLVLPAEIRTALLNYSRERGESLSGAASSILSRNLQGVPRHLVASERQPLQTLVQEELEQLNAERPFQDLRMELATARALLRRATEEHEEERSALLLWAEHCDTTPPRYGAALAEILKTLDTIATLHRTYTSGRRDEAFTREQLIRLASQYGELLRLSVLRVMRGLPLDPATIQQAADEVLRQVAEGLDGLTLSSLPAEAEIE